MGGACDQRARSIRGDARNAERGRAGRPDAPGAADRPRCRRRPQQRRDRRVGVPQREDGRDPPDAHLPQASASARAAVSRRRSATRASRPERSASRRPVPRTATRALPQTISAAAISSGVARSSRVRLPIAQKSTPVRTNRVSGTISTMANFHFSSASQPSRRKSSPNQSTPSPGKNTCTVANTMRIVSQTESSVGIGALYGRSTPGSLCRSTARAGKMPR